MDRQPHRQTHRRAEKQKDGRWRILGTAIKFTEANEQKAIAKFRKMTAQAVPIFIGDRRSKATFNPHDLEFFLQKMTDKTDAPFWERVVWELANRKEYAAQKTGIEKLAYLRGRADQVGRVGFHREHDGFSPQEKGRVH